jgi:hypothetical protein
LRLRFITLLAILILASLACRTLAAGSAQKSGAVLFRDDFSNPLSGWKPGVSGNGEARYQDGAYRISVSQPSSDVWASPGFNFADARIEVDASKAGGPDDNDFGVICRSNGSKNFYFFTVSSDGYYGIGKFKSGVQILIGATSMQTSDKILRGGQVNHIRADCVGNTLTLYVNGEKIQSVNDSDFNSGEVGLIAGAFEAPGTDIKFDNFTVLKP